MCPRRSPRSQPPKTILVAISGPSCSGKTTLARLLRSVLPSAPTTTASNAGSEAPCTAFVLHEDDFYYPDAQIPIRRVSDGRELRDWDCVGSINVSALQRMLQFVKREGRVADGFVSKEDRNDVGAVTVDVGLVARWREQFQSLLRDGVRDGHGRGLAVCIMDGFLLFPEDLAEVRALFDVRLLLTADYGTVKTRREARRGYVTLEGFWEDPKGYVDEIVWPNYVQDHAFLFKDGDVEGEVDDEVVARLGIEVSPKEAAQDMTACFQWAAERLKSTIEEKMKEER